MPKRRPADDDTVPEVGGIDTDILEQIGQHLERSNRFAETVFQPEYAPSSVVAEYDMGYFPTALERAYLQVRWYETGDFNIHYSEQYDWRPLGVSVGPPSKRSQYSLTFSSASRCSDTRG